MRTHVDLFSGIGGFSLACQWAGVETIAFSEIDSYASRVLQRRFPGIRNYGDVRGFPKLSAWLLTAGVPCQPASVAGKRKGAADDRWLWPETLAVVERCRPTWLCIENPLGIVSMEQPVMSIDLEGYGNLIEEAIRREGDFWAAITGEVEFIFRDLVSSVEQLGYQVAPVVIPACGLGAWHRRYRVWIMGHATSLQPRIGKQSTGTDIAGLSGSGLIPEIANGNGDVRNAEQARLYPTPTAGEHTKNRSASPNARTRPFRDFGMFPVAFDTRGNGPLRSIPNPDSTGFGEQRRAKSDEPQHAAAECDSWWATEPDVGRVVDGLPSRLDRLRGLGNAIVPQIAYQLVKRMIEAEAQCDYR